MPTLVLGLGSPAPYAPLPRLSKSLPLRHRLENKVNSLEHISRNVGIASLDLILASLSLGNGCHMLNLVRVKIAEGHGRSSGL